MKQEVVYGMGTQTRFQQKTTLQSPFFAIRYHLINCEDLPTIAFKLQCFIILKYIIFKLSITSLD